MNFTLNDNPSFKDLKEWFKENWEELPHTLDCDMFYITDLRSKIKKNIESINAIVKKKGNGVKKDVHAISIRRSLQHVYHSLKDPDRHNRPKKHSKMINKY